MGVAKRKRGEKGKGDSIILTIAMEKKGRGEKNFVNRKERN